MGDYLDRDALLDLDLDPSTVDKLLRATELSGHNGPIIEAERLPDLLEMLELEEGRS
jgi:hypothetical protein